MSAQIVAQDSAMQIRKLELGAWATNAYIVVCLETRQSVLVDVPPGARTLLKELRGTELTQILLTHSHIDHYAGLKAFRDRLTVPVECTRTITSPGCHSLQKSCSKTDSAFA